MSEWFMDEEQRKYCEDMAVKSFAIDLEWIYDDWNDGHITTLAQLKQRVENVLGKINAEIKLSARDKSIDKKMSKRHVVINDFVKGYIVGCLVPIVANVILYVILNILR